MPPTLWNRVLRPAALAALCLWSLNNTTYAQQHVNLERGLNAHSYLSGSFDHVNLYNGNLTLTIPIGQSYKVGGGLDYSLTLVYNSNSAWYFKREEQPNHGQQTRAEVNPKSNAGMGWTLSLGALYPPNQEGYNEDLSHDLYVAPDGSEHLFSGGYTHDGTFLRLRVVGGVRKVDFPNGQVHTFGSNNQLSKIEDRFGNVVDVDTTNPAVWLISEKCASCSTHTRQQKIIFGVGGQVESVRLTAFTKPNETAKVAEYKFHYSHPTIRRHRKDTWVRDNNADHYVNVWMLTGLELPAGAGWYDFTYNTDFIDFSGFVTSATLPTRGHYKWAYQRYTMPVAVHDPSPVCIPYCPDVLSPVSSTDGVLYKQIYDRPNGTFRGQFDYKLGGELATESDPRGWVSTTVRSPVGDETVNYFNNSYDETGYNAMGFGLPLNPRESVNSPLGDLFLSQEIYKGAAEAGKQPLRRVYLKYEGEPKPGYPGVSNNTRVIAQRTVYEDGLSADVYNKDWNGLGKFRTVETGGNFAHGNTRTTVTDYSSTHPDLGDPWILNHYNTQTVTEDSSASKVSFCFDPATGFLKRKRVHKGAASVPQDIFIEYTPDGDGNIASEKYYGGDKEGSAPDLTNMCDSFTKTPEYQIDHTYAYGTLATSKRVGQNFFTVDNDIDARTGLVSTSRDSSGLPTGFEYDELGRVKKVDSSGDADTYYTYIPAAGGDDALVKVDRKINENDLNPLTENHLIFDGFGRNTKQKERIPTGPTTTTLSVRETKYDAMGRVLSSSDYGDTTKTTQYTQYDPFGRAGRVIAPDGSVTDIDHTGVSRIKRTVNIGSSRDAAGNVVPRPATTYEFYDRQGRLQSVQEDSGPDNAPRATNYQYDIGNRLSRVAIRYGDDPSPARTNVALGAQVTASSTTNANFPATAVNDGDRTGVSWGAGGGWGDNSQGAYSADWVRVDFNALKEVSELRVYTLRYDFANRTDEPSCTETFNNADNSGYGIVDFDIQYLSSQGWKTVPNGRVVNNNLICRRVTFPAVWTKAVRVAVHKSVAWTTIPNNYSRIVEVEAYGRDVNQTVWVDDSLPAGAVPMGDSESWNWVKAWPWPFSGSTSHQSGNVAGMHQHYFEQATEKMTINAGDTLFAYVFIDAASPPRQVVLQWHSEAHGWNHRAYWGANLLPWGTNGTASRRRIGDLPAKGQWVRLEVPASLVGLEGKTVNGMAFSLYDGKATWDSAGKTAVAAPTTVNVARQPGATATASSQINGNFPVSAVNDGDRTGRNWGLGGHASGWNDATEGVFGSDWVRLDFAGARSIDEISVFTLRDNFAGGGAVSEGETFSTADDTGYGITYFEAQYWDGSRWRRVPDGLVGQTTDNNKVWTKLSFSAITTEKIRVMVRDSVVFTGQPSNYSRIVEIEAWQAAAPSNSQATQVRTFDYDNRGFLFSETHPEITGAVTYGEYDTLGNIGRKVEGGKALKYIYDSTGRLLNVREEATGRLIKEVAYYADGKVRKATRYNWVQNPYSTDPNAPEHGFKVSEEYTYGGRGGRMDGRTTRLHEDLDTHYRFNQTFQYDELGNLSSQSYPACQNARCVQSGAATPRTVKYGYTNGHLTRVWRDAPTAHDYAANISYHANRMVNTVSHGNGVTDTYARNATNNMGRPHQITVSGPAVNWTTGQYEYDGAGNVVKMGADWFLYDGANRVKEGTAGTMYTGAQRKQAYTYDTMGNVLSINTTDEVGTQPFTNNVDPATNRLAGVSYDAAGNLLGVSAQLYHYDSLNMMKKLPGKTYLYGPGDERVWVVDKQYNDLDPVPSPAPAVVETITLRGLGNEVLREYTVTGGDAVGNWAWAKDYVYRGGKLLSSESPSGRLDYHVDHLGTPRVVTTGGGQQWGNVQYLYPFGAEAQTVPERLKFTGHERDENPFAHRLDYMHARYYGFNNGRFINVDPGRDFDPKQPQSWNRYSYVRGNPVNSTDPTGRYGIGIGAYHAMQQYKLKFLVIASEPEVKKAILTAWKLADSGNSRREASFYVRKGGAINGVPFYHVPWKPSRSNVPGQDSVTVVPGGKGHVFHTHGNVMSHLPSTAAGRLTSDSNDVKTADESGNVVWVIHKKGLSFYDPATKATAVLISTPNGDWLEYLRREMDKNPKSAPVVPSNPTP